MKLNNLLTAMAVYHKGDWDNIYSDIKENYKPFGNEDFTDEELEKMNSINLLNTKDYPLSLKHTENPPFVIFYKGDKDLLKGEHILAVVGGEYVGYQSDINAIDEGFDKLNNKNIIITKLTKGMNELVIEKALEKNAKVIAVLDSGIDNPLNKELADKIVTSGGLIISEYPENVKSTNKTKEYSDRIVAGLCTHLILNACYQNKESCYKTTLLANNYGKTIGCIPTSLNNYSMCNKLISQGAELINSADYIMDFFALPNDFKEKFFNLKKEVELDND